jgi:hypothetical protein
MAAVTRPPRTKAELFAAHLRPQPAIPAVAVLMLSILFAASSSGAAGAGNGSFAPWLIAAGILVSCGLAVAAGFCSFFPPLAWLILAALFLRSTHAWAATTPVRVAFFSGVLTTGAMLVVQTWRVRTGRFVPTVGEDEQPSGL